MCYRDEIFALSMINTMARSSKRGFCSNNDKSWLVHLRMHAQMLHHRHEFLPLKNRCVASVCVCVCVRALVLAPLLEALPHCFARWLGHGGAAAFALWPSSQHAMMSWGSSSCHHSMLLSHKDPAAIITERYYVIGIQQPSSQNAITSWGSSSRHHRMLFHWEPAAVITERCYFMGIQQPSSQNVLTSWGSSSCQHRNS